MGGVLSKPKIAGPSAEELKAREDARKAQEEEKALLAQQKEEEERKKIAEMKMLQQRKRGQRYGGMRSLLADRQDPEMGVKKTTLG
jgi:hypothetical protein